jgi:hypothetical protein
MPTTNWPVSLRPYARSCPAACPRASRSRSGLSAASSEMNRAVRAEDEAPTRARPNRPSSSRSNQLPCRPRRALPTSQKPEFPPSARCALSDAMPQPHAMTNAVIVCRTTPPRVSCGPRCIVQYTTAGWAWVGANGRRGGFIDTSYKTRDCEAIIVETSSRTSDCVDQSIDSAPQ